MAELVLPSLEYAGSCIDALREGFRVGVGGKRSEAEIREIERDIKAHIHSRNVQGGTIDCPDGIIREKVPYTTFWLVEGGEFIGEVSFRHELNDFLEKFGGHIGYGIRPSRRRQGYGTLGLKLCLKKARAVGLRKVLVTCDPENTGSKKIIEANGGTLEDIRKFEWQEGATARYWISL